MTGNIVRSTEADYHSQLAQDPDRRVEGTGCDAVPPYSDRHWYIVLGANLAQLDHDETGLFPPKEDEDEQPSKPEDARHLLAEKLQRGDIHDACMEAFRAIDKLDIKLLESAEVRPANYPIRFSVDGAITVTIPVSSDPEFLEQHAEVLRELAFFELLDAGLQVHVSDGDVQLHLPLLLIKNQPRYPDEGSNESARVARSQEQRIATSSAAWFLAHLGIKDFPVFGLVTCGKEGYLS